MMAKRVTSVFFSPSGATEKIVSMFSARISNNVHSINLLTEIIHDEIQFRPDDIVVIALPVFFGRIPSVCVNMLKNMKGNKTPLIALAVYGNRAYEDALLELTDILEANSFIITAAGALIAQHSIFPQIASGRPDQSDTDKIKEFAEKCTAILEYGEIGSVPIPGNTPYRSVHSLLFHPYTDHRCIHCCACATNCPVSAISKENPRVTDKKACINCTSCIHVCPVNARKYHGLKYEISRNRLKKICTPRREPEFFYSAK